MNNKKNNNKLVQLIYSGNIDKVDEDYIFQNSFYKLTPEEKLAAAWELVENVWELKGKDLNELRFNRAVAIIKPVQS